MFKRIAPVVALSLLSGCTLLKGDEYHQATLNAIHDSKTNLAVTLTNLQQQLNQQNTQIDALHSQVTHLERNLANLHQDVKNPIIVTTKAQMESTPLPLSSQPTIPRQDLILGEIERVLIDNIQETFDARIDTGAATSSLNAVDVEEFERDGKKWVRFHLVGDDNEADNRHWIEAPVVRYVRIRQATSEQTERRAVVELWVQLGSIHQQAQFTLADRSQMNHPILLGREFIRDIAVVDVSRKYIQTDANTSTQNNQTTINQN